MPWLKQDRNPGSRRGFLTRQVGDDALDVVAFPEQDTQEQDDLLIVSELAKHTDRNLHQALCLGTSLDQELDSIVLELRELRQVVLTKNHQRTRKMGVRLHDGEEHLALEQLMMKKPHDDLME